jgi:AcrR family transcriptional regulator
MTPHTDPSREPRAPLSRDRVLHAAIRLADEGGIESLTMRKLGRALGVEAMSLYKHVANKDDVLDGIVDLVEGEIELPSSAQGWAAAIRTCAISAHEVLRRHPWAPSLIMTRFRPARLRYMDWLLGQLRGAGFPPQLTYHAYHALDSHILGFTLWEAGHSVDTEDLADAVATFLQELPADHYPHFAEHVRQHLTEPGLDDVGGFQFQLDLILDGLLRLQDSIER